jgi:DNA integrity scanning protein DisA with diadenylate cyclase activity
LNSDSLLQVSEEVGNLVKARKMIYFVETEPVLNMLLSRNSDSRLIASSKPSLLGMVDESTRLQVPEITPTNPTKYAVMKCLDRGLVRVGDTVVCVMKRFWPLDTIYIVPVEEPLKDELSFLREVGIEVLETVLRIAVELGREGKEGMAVGTAFIVGDPKGVLENSHQMILNPFKGHPRVNRNVLNPEIKEVIKSFSLLDGAFVVSEKGQIECAGRYLDVDASDVEIPAGLGARHAAVAGITRVTRSVGVTVSKSGGIVRIFKSGKLIRGIDPKSYA